MEISVNLSIHTGILCLIVLGTTACQTSKPVKQASMNTIHTDKTAGPLIKQREAGQLTLCQKQLDVLKSLGATQYQHYKQAFDALMKGASQYASLRPQISADNQESVDALYQYKVNYLCSGINQAVLTTLSERGEHLK